MDKPQIIFRAQDPRINSNILCLQYLVNYGVKLTFFFLFCVTYPNQPVFYFSVNFGFMKLIVIEECKPNANKNDCHLKQFVFVSVEPVT